MDPIATGADTLWVPMGAQLARRSRPRMPAREHVGLRLAARGRPRALAAWSGALDERMGVMVRVDGCDSHSTTIDNIAAIGDL